MVFPFGEGGAAWAECDAHRKKDDMPLDIDKLRLTKSEYYDVIRKVYIYATPSYPKEVIDAQLAKALWIVRFWLDAWGIDRNADEMGDMLKEMLEQAGIPRPEENHARN